MTIHLGPPLPTASSGQPGSTGGQPLTLPYLALLLAGFTWHRTSPPDPVSSYLTLSPLPAIAKLRQADFSLWHFPWGRPRWTLSSAMPYGARTFLHPKAAVTWSASANSNGFAKSPSALLRLELYAVPCKTL